MSDYLQKTVDDFPWQFKDKPKIMVLIRAIARQLQEVADFMESLNLDRRIDTAEGTQLDRIGDIVVLTRAQAGLLTGDPITVDVLDDETYRKYLKYKILLNTSDCTYQDLVDGLRMFFEDTVIYREDIDKPATLIFRVPSDIAYIMNSMPIIRASGVGLLIEAFDTETDYDLVSVFAIFLDDKYTFVWTQDETIIRVENGVLILGEFTSNVTDQTLIPPDATTISGQTVQFHNS